MYVYLNGRQIRLGKGSKAKDGRARKVWDAKGREARQKGKVKSAIWKSNVGYMEGNEE